MAMKLKGTSAKVERTLIPYLSMIEDKVNQAIDRMGSRSQQLVEDDEVMRSIFELIHQQLPWGARWMLRRDRFVAICMTNRRRFLRQSTPPTGQEALDKKA